MKLDDITFHPRYEAKAVDFITREHPELINNNSLFWIIGSLPDINTTSVKINKNIPTGIKLLE